MKNYLAALLNTNNIKSLKFWTTILMYMRFLNQVQKTSNIFA